MTACTLEETLRNAVIDKVLLGALVGLTAWFANRAFERYRSHESIRVKAGEMRVTLLAELCGELQRIHLEILQVEKRGRVLLNQDLAEARQERLSDKRLPLLHGPSPRWMTRYERDICPALTRAKADCDTVTRDAFMNHFWLGEVLRLDIVRKARTLHALAVAVDKALRSGEMDATLEAARKGLDAAFLQQDIDSVIQKL